MLPQVVSRAFGVALSRVEEKYGGNRGVFECAVVIYNEETLNIEADVCINVDEHEQWQEEEEGKWRLPLRLYDVLFNGPDSNARMREVLGKAEYPATDDILLVMRQRIGPFVHAAAILGSKGEGVEEHHRNQREAIRNTYFYLPTLAKLTEQADAVTRACEAMKEEKKKPQCIRIECVPGARHTFILGEEAMARAMLTAMDAAVEGREDFLAALTVDMIALDAEGKPIKLSNYTPVLHAARVVFVIRVMMTMDLMAQQIGSNSVVIATYGGDNLSVG